MPSLWTHAADIHQALRVVRECVQFFNGQSFDPREVMRVVYLITNTVSVSIQARQALIRAFVEAYAAERET